MGKKVVVLEGMLKAAIETLGNKRWGTEVPQLILEGALLWLSENPMVPNSQQLAEMREEWNHVPAPTPSDYALYAITWWQRRMFEAPEEEVPVEIADLQVTDMDKGWDGPINQRIREAYRRGQKSALAEPTREETDSIKEHDSLAVAKEFVKRRGRSR